MAVQAGEGTTDIIYGSTSIPAGPFTLGGYLARPDGRGEWPTLLVYGPAPSPTSSIKNMCRILARHGIAALAPDMTTDHGLNRRRALQVAAFISNPSGSWSNAQFGYGLLGFGPGIIDVAGNAADDGRVAAIGFVDASIDDLVLDDLALANVPSLYIGSRGQDEDELDASLGHRDLLRRTTFVIYPESPQGWWDDTSDGFDSVDAADTLERVIAFFNDQLPPRV